MNEPKKTETNPSANAEEARATEAEGAVDEKELDGVAGGLDGKLRNYADGYWMGGNWYPTP